MIKIFAFRFGEDIETAVLDALISLQGIHGEKGLKGYSELEVTYDPEPKDWPSPEKLEVLAPQVILGSVAHGEEKAFQDFFKPYKRGHSYKVYFGSEKNQGVVRSMGFDQVIDGRLRPSQVIEALKSKKSFEKNTEESFLKKLTKKYWS